MLKLTAMTVTCILGACFLAPLPVLAEQHGGNWEAVFKNADKDNDGTLDKNEAKAMPRVSKHFDEIDADKDGTISMDEMKASMEHMRKAMHEKGKAAFKEADKDNDGTLDKEEAKALPRVSEHFDEIDADKDGTISMDEMKASMEHMRKTMHEKGKAAFKEADKDNDGTLDKEEAKAMPRVSKNFDAIDADKDGTVSPDEIRAFMKSQRQGGGPQKGAGAEKGGASQ